MDKANENRNSMFKGVDQFFIERQDKIQGVPVLVRRASAFHTLCIEIDKKQSELLASPGGKTEDKQAAEDRMLDSTYLVKSYLMSFGYEMQDNSILVIVSIPEWKLAQMRDTEQTVYSRKIYDLADTHSEALVEHGLEPEDLPLLKSRIDEFEVRLAQREGAPGTAKVLRESLLSLISTASATLDRIDESMKKFRTKDPEFYNQYKAIRIVKDVGVRHRPDTGAEAPEPETQEAK